jgi:hypothetical protein
MYKEVVNSAIIESIKTELKNGKTALSNETTELKNNEIKLFIERIDQDYKHLLATFIWNNGDMQSDEILIGRVIKGQNLQSEMKNIPGTDLWHVSFIIDNAFPEIAGIEKRFAITSLRYKVRPVALNSPLPAGI